MVRIWFFSDPHFGHANIIKYCDRPFASPEEMDAFMLERINSVVKPGDHWWSLGDWSMRRPTKDFAKQINGEGGLVMGNHDVYKVQDYLAAGIKKIAAYRVYPHSAGGNILFSHIPIHPKSMGRFKANVHGHIHNAEPYGFPYINLSMEAIDYTPVSLEALQARIVKEELSHVYQESYGDDKLCDCGHQYWRHFDSYDGMAPVGCKYCPCGTFRSTQKEAIG